MLAMLDKLDPVVRNAARIVVGFTFWSHGAQKLFGWFGGSQTVDLLTRFGIAGMLEFIGGLMVVVGIFHRPVAFVLAGEMAVAYWWIHVGGGGLWWWGNNGELALVYCFFFLLFAVAGGGKFSFDGLMETRAAQKAS